MTHVLVVDDDEPVRVGLKQCLVQLGCRVTLAAGGREALESIAGEKPDLVFLDIMMPWMDGFDVLKVLRLDPATHNLPVILLTPKSADADVYRWLWEKDEDYLYKPPVPRGVQAKLEWVRQTGRLPPRVLIVDDEVKTRWSVAWALRESGVRADTAESVEEAMERLACYRPDLVILDVVMPGTEGFDLLQRIRESRETGDLPVLMLTARSADADAPSGNWSADGENGYYEKPFVPGELAHWIVQWLRRNRI